MDTKHLQTFLTAARTLNFTQTAKILDYAQSSITAQIKSLEEELDTTLFERLGKRIYLTEAGIQLYQYAEKMIKLGEEMRFAVSLENESNIVLTIGAQESQCTYRLPGVLQRFKQLHPHVKLIFKPVHTSEIAKNLLETGSLDMAIVTDAPKKLPSIHKETLLQETLVIIASPAHKLSNHPALSLEDISKETILLNETGCSYRALIEKKMHDEGIYPKHLIEFVSIETIKQCVIAGLGVSFLPKMAVEKELKNGQLLQLPIPLGLSPLYTEIALHKDKVIPAYLEDFIDIVRKKYKGSI
ncbi:LysR family transcriptional regulator [Bacillus mesophilum]|uniref:LysR family transcriptional regulator n=1 Tax=Bacillus mesophilum TaxID=1071718 RepID=A0A7V7RIW4_9BACI|nr:LysR family transcriptional regulator [Bacillus mesophilum]KAB2328910.1 LysR family transcriptional regulator [Bacillus mesophilum]